MNSKEAKKILPKNEYETFESIFMNQFSRMASHRLKQRATLSRRLRDKYRDLARRQAAGVRGRRTNETDTRLHDRRALLFQEVIDRIEAELDRPRRSRTQAASRKEREKNGQDRQSDARVKRTLSEAKRRRVH